MHDVGAGGLSNAIPELLHDSGVGGVIDLAKMPSDDPSLSPMQLWCNESQERYVLGIAAGASGRVRSDLRARALPVRGGRHRHRRRAPGGGLRRTAGNGRWHRAENRAIDLPMDLLFGKAPKMHRDTAHAGRRRAGPELELPRSDLRDAGLRVLAHPTVAAKQLPGHHRRPHRRRPDRARPDGRPVADAGGRLRDHPAPISIGFAGEAMAIGERTPLALLDAAASARMAVGEAHHQPAPPRRSPSLDRSQAVRQLDGRRRRIRAKTRCCTTRCKAVGLELCPELDISIPVGKDSLSMQAQWQMRRRRRTQVGVAGVADHHRLRAASPTCARNSTPLLTRDSRFRAVADRPGRRQAAHGRPACLAPGARTRFGNACPDLDDAAAPGASCSSN